MYVGQSSYGVTTGSSVTLQCFASGNPAVTSVSWQRLFNNQYSALVIDGSKYSGGSIQSPSLTISSTDSNDGGTYRCAASNSVGTGYSQDTSLTVSGSTYLSDLIIVTVIY